MTSSSTIIIEELEAKVKRQEGQLELTLSLPSLLALKLMRRELEEAKQIGLTLDSTASSMESMTSTSKLGSSSS